MSKGILLSPKHGVNPMVLLCVFCGESKGIALLGKLKDDAEAPREGIADYKPCDNCKVKMARGITVIEVASEEHQRPTGRWMVVKEEAVQYLLNTEEARTTVLRERRCAIAPETFNMIMESFGQ